MSAPCLNRFEKPPLLRADSISKAFGGVQALLNVSFEVSEGTILGIIGPNGAGKTTLFNVITSAYPPDSGQLFLDRKKFRTERYMNSFASVLPGPSRMSSCLKI